MKTKVLFYELDAEQKLEAVNQVANLEDKTEEVLFSELEQDYDIDADYNFLCVAGGVIVVSKIVRKFNLKDSLDQVSLDFVTCYYELTPHEDSIGAFNAHGSAEWIKFMYNGKTFYSPTGSPRDVLVFHSHQDAVDFIRVK